MLMVSEWYTNSFMQHEASNHGYIALVELLLDSGAFVNVPGCDNETPLHDAVTMNRVEVVRLLLARGADKQAKYANMPLSVETQCDNAVLSCVT